jgi:hypothetical protein
VAVCQVSWPLDAIYARQFMLDIEDNYVQALLNADTR